jgi:redox-sensitive bicupin YhaK (pirin superfamily)
MSAGSGVQHSEFNHAQGEETHFLQIWIEPNVKGILPSYEQKTFEPVTKQGILKLVASPTGTQGSVTIHADACIYAGLFNAGESASLNLAVGHKSYVHLIRGELKVNGLPLKMGDAAKLVDEPVQITDAVDAEVLVFDLA